MVMLNFVQRKKTESEKKGRKGEFRYLQAIKLQMLKFDIIPPPPITTTTTTTTTTTQTDIVRSLEMDVFIIIITIILLFNIITKDYIQGKKLMW